MATLAQQRCLNHESREAVCRCLSCDNFFCRECVAIFETRLLCATCLAVLSSAPEQDSARRHFGIGAAVLTGLGLLVAWLLFYVAGWAILQLHERAPVGLLGFAVLRFPQ
jgi:hypothetical protein